jgi:hypothetical protein
MGGFLRFLLGGVLGAALGFFLSRRQARTATRRPGAYQLIDRAEPQPAPTVAAPAAAVAPTAEPVWGPETTTEPEVEAETATEPEVEAEPATEPGVEAEPSSWPEPPVEPLEEPSRAEALLGEDELAHIVEPVAEEVSEVAPPPVERQTTVIPAEELRARFEASRRRIREELEEPFQIRDAEAAVREPATSEPAVHRAEAVESEVVPVPPDLAAGEVEPLAEEAPAPVVEVQIADDSFFEEMGVRVDRLTLTGEPEVEGDLRSRMTGALSVSADVLRPTPSELETSLNYDVMRARIEEARNRLKAKAAEAQTGMGEQTSKDLDARIPPQESPAAEDESDADDIEAKIDRLLSEEQY